MDKLRDSCLSCHFHVTVYVMSESATYPSVLRPIHLVPFEDPSTTIESTVQTPQEPSEALSIAATEEATTEQATFFRKAGGLAVKAAGVIEDKLTEAAIYTQIKVWNASEKVYEAVEGTKDYLKREGSKALAHGALAGLAIAAGAGALTLRETETAHAATNQANYQIVDGPWYVHTSAPIIHSPTVGLAQTGDTLTITCHETGDNVSGDAEWDQVTDQNNGLQGLIADYGTNTPVHQGQEAVQLTALGIPECGSSDPANTPAPAKSANPSAPNYVGACKASDGVIALESVENSLAAVDDSEKVGTLNLKSQLAVYDSLWGNQSADDICVGAQLSGPDTTNHRQFVGDIIAESPSIDPGGCTDQNEVEIWGDGFYQTTNCTTPTIWHINKWLANGTNVCAAISSRGDTSAKMVHGNPVGTGPLGSTDPFREITCFQIKA